MTRKSRSTEASLGDLEEFIEQEQDLTPTQVKQGLRALLEALDELKDTFDSHTHAIDDLDVRVDISEVSGETDTPQ